MKQTLYILCLVFFSCLSNNEDWNAQKIIDKSIDASGVGLLYSSKLNFDFRNISYQAIRENGKFVFSRSFDSIYDELSNNGFKRFVDKKQVNLSDSLANVYSNSVNSVHYFSVLPFNLNDKAVYKKKLEDAEINKQSYYKIRVTFSENGGGDDYEDVFIYWINKKNFLIDYLAYSYKTDGGGMRFRALKNEVVVKNVHFRNYDNYKPKNTIHLEKIDSAFVSGDLVKVSEIVLENIKLTLN